MKREKVLLGLRVVVSLAMALLIFEGLAHAQRYNLSQYFPLAEGTTWTYLQIKPSQPKEIEAKCIAKISDQAQGWIYRSFLFDSGEQEDLYSYADMNWSRSGLEVYKTGTSVGTSNTEYRLFDPPSLRFPRSMSIGDTFRHTTTATEYDLSGNVVDTFEFVWEITLVARENVQVKAGNFANCLRFTVLQSDNEATENWTMWLAPGIGEVKNAEDGEVGELLSLTTDKTTYYPNP